MLYGDGKHDDTLALQEMLDKKGIITIERPGTYLISKTLIIHSDTRLVCSPGVIFLAAPYSKCALIENEHFADASAKDYNIEILGGIWDGNCDNMGLDAVYEALHREDDPYDPKLFKGKLLRFAHVEQIVLEKLTVKNPVSYGIQIAASRGFVVRDIYFDYNWHFGTTDGVHINGPSCDGVIENLYGTTNDDMVSLTTIDESHAEISMGEISNISIRNVSAKNGYSGIRLLSAGNFAIKRIHICGVYGDYRHNAVLISHHYTRPGTAIWFDDITLEHIHASKSSTPLTEDCFCLWEDNAIEQLPVIWLEEGIHAGKIILRDISRHETAPTQAPLVQIDPTAKINRLFAENISQTTAPGVDAPLWSNEGDIGELISRL